MYGLLVFGPEAEKRVWMVLDKSKSDATRYDVLYVNVNANGDLTEAGERLVLGDNGQDAGGEQRFRLAEFKDPATGEKHTGFSVRLSGGTSQDDPPNVMVSLKWRDKFKMAGGYPEDPDSGYMKFAEKPADAPIVWADGDGPYRFQRWYGDKLTIGAADDLKVFVGQPGRGNSTFWAFTDHYLPEGEGVQATLVYRDAADKEQRAVCELKERC